MIDPGWVSLYKFPESTDAQVLSVVTIVSEVPALAERIRKSYGGDQIIGIDGFPLAGKTTLADRLSVLLDADVVSTDGPLQGRQSRRDPRE